MLKGEPAAEPPRRSVDAHRERRLRRHASTRSPTTARRVLAVASGKGGVGKSSVTTNLAVALAQRGHRVAAVDADVWGFSMPRMLGVTHPPGLIDDVIVPPQAHGVKLISMGFFAREDQAIIWRGPMLHKALEQFLTDVHWGELDYLVVDMPPGTGDVSLSMSQFIPRAEMIVVTTPQPAAQRVAQRAAAMAEKVDLEVVGIVENMSWFTGDDGTRYELFGSGGGARARRAPRRAAARPGAARPRAAGGWRRGRADRRRAPRRRGVGRRSARSPSASTPSSPRSASTAPSSACVRRGRRPTPGARTDPRGRACGRGLRRRSTSPSPRRTGRRTR